MAGWTQTFILPRNPTQMSDGRMSFTKWRNNQRQKNGRGHKSHKISVAKKRGGQNGIDSTG